jgi:putative solute:sodium symporter small subunit
MSQKVDGEGYWRETRKLTFITLGIWAFFSFFIHFFAAPLNNIVILGFPMGYYMGSQGSIAVFVVLLFWFCARQEKIDRDFGVHEE